MTVSRLLIIIVLLFVVVLGYRFINSTGLLRSLEEVSYGQCETLPGPIGPEDITVDPRNGIAFISADERRRFLGDGEFGDTPNGEIWTLDTRTPNAKPVKMLHDLEGPFHPHGIALFAPTNELYVVNHISGESHEINVFRIESPERLSLRTTITYPELISPNDIIVVSQDNFYVTNDHGNPRGTLMEKVEDYLTLPLSSVSYYDGSQGHIAIEGIRMANGIAISEDQQTLFIAASMENSLLRYKRGANALDWKPDGSVFVASVVDNLEWTQHGTLLTGAHPRPLDFIRHANDPSISSASEVIEFDVRATPMTSQTIHLDFGDEISGSSVAALAGDTLLIGTVFDEQLTRCTPSAAAN